jgi:hypothetical protein
MECFRDECDMIPTELVFSMSNGRSAIAWLLAMASCYLVSLIGWVDECIS